MSVIKHLNTGHLTPSSPVQTPVVWGGGACRLFCEPYVRHKYINTFGGENVDYFSVNAGGECSNSCKIGGSFSRS
jgi:hypothetical protein